MDPDQALRAYEQALDRLPRLASSDAVSRRNGVEVVYAQAYQTLVRLGLRPQIRGKYRSL